MVDFFTVPPVFVSVYLNRSWLGKSGYLFQVFPSISPFAALRLINLFSLYSLARSHHFSFYLSAPPLHHSLLSISFRPLSSHVTPPFISSYPSLCLPIPLLSPHYWECVSEALSLWAAVNFPSSLEVTGLGSSDVSGNTDTAEWMG